MKTAMLFTGSGPIVILTSHDSVADPILLEKLKAKGTRYYLLSYCSPSRAGKHKLMVKVTFKGKSGSLEHEFNAKGFRAGCDPKRRPNFSLRRVRLKKR